MQFCLVSYNFESYDLFCEMVEALDDLAKRPVSQSFDDLVSEENVFLWEYMDIVAICIIVTVVFDAFFALLGLGVAKIVDCIEEFELYSFLFRKELLVIFKEFVFSHGVFGSFSLRHGDRV